MRVIEQRRRSKTGSSLETCEDNLIVTRQYACVVDGATSCSTKRWTSENLTGGQWASRVVCQAVQEISVLEDHDPQADCMTPPEIVSHVTQSLSDAYKKEGVWEYMKHHPQERATASFVLYSYHRQQLIMVGDCQAMITVTQFEPQQQGKHVIIQQQQQQYHHEKFVDTVTSQARAMFLSSELLLNSNTTTTTTTTDSETTTTQNDPPLSTIQDLQKCDTGRQFIQDLLIRQRLFQNNPNAPSKYRYWVMDGFPIDMEEGVHIHPLITATTTTATCPNSIQQEQQQEKQPPCFVTEVILATDGYPKLFPTLAETEAYWKQCVTHDPLLISHNDDDDDIHDMTNSTKHASIVSTKGVALHAESYDDRTYLRLQL